MKRLPDGRRSEITGITAKRAAGSEGGGGEVVVTSLFESRQVPIGVIEN